MDRKLITKLPNWQNNKLKENSILDIFYKSNFDKVLSNGIDLQKDPLYKDISTFASKPLYKLRIITKLKIHYFFTINGIWVV
jgi:hypothetical protein